jgi:hypothetical protein
MTVHGVLFTGVLIASTDANGGSPSERKIGWYTRRTVALTQPSGPGAMGLCRSCSFRDCVGTRISLTARYVPLAQTLTHVTRSFVVEIIATALTHHLALVFPQRITSFRPPGGTWRSPFTKTDSVKRMMQTYGHKWVPFRRSIEQEKTVDEERQLLYTVTHLSRFTYVQPRRPPITGLYSPWCFHSFPSRCATYSTGLDCSS